MASLRAERDCILGYIRQALGDEGQQDVALPLAFPARESQIPRYFSQLESLELYWSITGDRRGPIQGKPLTVDLYLPRRGLYLELDREGHDLTAERAASYPFYPDGLPRGFRTGAFRRLIAELTEQAGSSPGMVRMNRLRAAIDFTKDLYVEGELGLTLVRLPKPELAWLLANGPDEPKHERIRQYLKDKAQELNLPSLLPA